MGVHDGHRKRIKDKFKDHGLESFTDIEALEMLLFYALPRKNTNELSHELLNRFGGYRGVLEADVEELVKVEGIGEHAALLISLVRDLNRRYVRSGHKKGIPLTNGKKAGDFLVPMFSYTKREMVLLVCLDSASKLIRCHELASGEVGKVLFSVRDIVNCVVKDDAARVIVAHNHLLGPAIPSSDDIATTRQLRSALKELGVELADHIIVSGETFVSMEESGFFSDI